MQKMIVGKVSTDTPFTYISPLQRMISVANTTKTLPFSYDIAINGQNPSFFKIAEITNLEGSDLGGFTRLGLSADFASFLNAYGVVSGDYGIALNILHEKGSNQIFLNTSDMYGNLYSSNFYKTQEKVFDISAINGIKLIEVYLFQEGNFKTKDNNEFQSDNGISVKNINIYFGYDTSAVSQEELKLYTKNNLTYRYSDESLVREIYLKWIHFISENNQNKILVLTDNDIYDKEEFEVRWYQYVESLETSKTDSYGGPNWLKIETINNADRMGEIKSPLQCKIILDSTKQVEKFKAVGVWKKTNDAILVFESNIIEFVNEITQNVKTSDFNIICEDGSNAQYFYYNQNGEIKDTAFGIGQKRKLKAQYKGESLTSIFGDTIDFLYWEVPINNEKTMLSIEIPSDEIIENANEDYQIIKRTNISKENFDCLDYCIKNFWQSTCLNNNIKCVLSVNGIIYEAIKSFSFGEVSAQENNYTFQLEFKNNINAISLAEQEGVQVEAILRDSSGNRVLFGESLNKISWGWWKAPSQEYLELIAEENNEIVNIKPLVDLVPEDNFYILQATATIEAAFGDNIVLNTYLPIPIRANKNYIKFSGADRILYNDQGIPKYNTGPYILTNNNNQEVVCLIKIKNSEQTFDNQLQIRDYYPSLKTYEGRKVGLSASPFYLKDLENKVCVYAVDGETVLWSQPILITQGNYSFNPLSKWDGVLTLDEENGIILSAMIGAGKKNDDDSFSGVLLGDVQNSDETGSITNTGVYGFDHGKMVYSLKDDGTATFGVKGKGQIKLDGNEGTIVSGNWDDQQSGMKIDLDDGILRINDQGKSRIFISPGTTSENSYFQVKSNNENTLINISNNNYYLQSDDYNANNRLGTKIDLSNGSINVASADGSVRIQPRSPFFRVEAQNKILLQMGQGGYFLQSQDYSEDINMTSFAGEIIYITPAGENVYKKKDDYYYASNNEKIEFSLTEEEKNDIKEGYEESQWETEFKKAINQKINYFKNSLVPRTSENGQGKGMRINLEDGNIIGYNLYLKATNAKNQALIINGSSESDFPLMIGEHFKVDWNGHLWCDKVTIGNNNNQATNYVINIANDFVIDENGKGYWKSGRIGQAAAAINTLSALDINSDIAESITSSVDVNEYDKAILIYKDGKIQQGYTLNALVEYLKGQLQN